MLQEMSLEPNKTYATKDNAVKALEKLYGGSQNIIRYIVVQNKDGRWFPVCLFQDSLQAGTHFNFVTISG